MQPTGHTTFPYGERTNPPTNAAPATMNAPAIQKPAPLTSAHVRPAEFIRTAELAPTNAICVAARNTEETVRNCDNRSALAPLRSFRAIATRKMTPPIVNASKASVIPRNRTETNAKTSSSCATGNHCVRKGNSPRVM